MKGKQIVCIIDKEGNVLHEEIAAKRKHKHVVAKAIAKLNQDKNCNRK